MRLLRKALIPYPFKLEKILSNTQHRYIPEPNAITITCKSYQLSIYLKLNQLLDEITRQENGIIPSEHASEIENATGQIRIELREYRSQLRINKKKIHCGNDEALLLNGSNTHPYTTLCKRLGSMYGTGDFWLYDDARDIIKESDYYSIHLVIIVYSYLLFCYTPFKKQFWRIRNATLSCYTY